MSREPDDVLTVYYFGDTAVERLGTIHVLGRSFKAMSFHGEYLGTFSDRRSAELAVGRHWRHWREN
jgi:hypothetical protein